ncbi:MAG: sialate O-acetylesterase [Pedobacter sp.]|nr:MAG: sialate O-acetylesterase [Pedobacter sp.]
MVLQREKPLKIWGWATPGEKVAIIFNGIKMIAITDQEGKWNTSFRAMKAGGPYKMDIIGHNKISLEDIMIGDVWFCSGQSNMVLPMERLKYQYPREVSQDSFPRIRNFFVQTKAYVLKEKEDLPPGKWTPAIGKGLLEFGGVSYFFAKKLYQKYQVPIGLINASVGGSPIEAWLSVEGYRNFPQYQAEIANFRNLQHRKALDSAVSAYTTAHSKPLSVLIDKGISGPVKWIDTAYVPKKWHPFFLPGYWSDQGVKRLNGIIYFRKEIELPAFLSGMPARLLMGNITDADSTFINGVFVGNTTYQYPPRNYNVPSGVLKSGRNIIVVKVVSNSGKGGFVPDKKYQIEAAGQRFDLRGDWSYQVGMVYEKPNEMPLVNVNDTIPRPINEQSSATGLFNAMVSPVTGYPIRGFLWYQGETNTARANEYGQILKALIADWRDKWREGDIPFIYAQLPNFMEVEYSPSESSWAALRQAQLETLSVSNTGMAVTIDAGEWNDIHPLNKKDIGERMALWAEYFQGEDKKIVFSGPLISTARKKGDKVVLNFNHLGGGLKSRDGEDLRYFSIAGADGRYKWAKAIIQGNEILVWNEEVSSPVYLRYAWADNPQSANLINAEGLPASPFQVKIEQ